VAITAKTEPVVEAKPAIEVKPVAETKPAASPADGKVTHGTPEAGSGAGAGTGTGTASDLGAGAAGTGKTVGGTTVLPFSDGMTRPNLLSKVDPIYTAQARAGGVEGLILTKCVITTRGELQQCKIVKGLPFMDRAVLEALAQWRYSPVLYQGKPTAVEYVIPVRLVRP
jgi:protein TonB